MAFSGISIAVGLTGAATLKQIFRIKFNLNLLFVLSPLLCDSIYIFENTLRKINESLFIYV